MPPICIITIGMAGSGKSSFVHSLNSHLNSPYILNLDPAVTNTPFDPNIDIRDTVDYHEVMKQCAVTLPTLSLLNSIRSSKVQLGT
jgi:GPN-loop GTPase